MHPTGGGKHDVSGEMRVRNASLAPASDPCVKTGGAAQYVSFETNASSLPFSIGWNAPAVTGRSGESVVPTTSA